MLNRRKATILRIVSERPGAVELLVEVDGRQEMAICYPDLSGPVAPGDEVLLNTTAVDLDLGTGGVHFVICNLSRPVEDTMPSPGHIMKLRYTPLQEAVLSVEEDDNPDQKRIQEFESLDGMPVICCELHSQIAPAAAAFKALTEHKGRIAYIMTDGAALPIGLSRLVAELKEKELLDATITCGQAIGGDIEAINLYTALIAAKEVALADAVIVCQGPGNAGTGSKYGFSGIQQVAAIQAADSLEGRAIVVFRISFADSRERHRGISHHTFTVLELVPPWTQHLMVLPELPWEKAMFVGRQLKREAPSRVGRELDTMDGEVGLAELARKGVQVTTMGRSVEQDREFFLAASAGGVVAAELLQGK